MVTSDVAKKLWLMIISQKVKADAPENHGRGSSSQEMGSRSNQEVSPSPKEEPQKTGFQNCDSVCCVFPTLHFSFSEWECLVFSSWSPNESQPHLDLKERNHRARHEYATAGWAYLPWGRNEFILCAGRRVNQVSRPWWSLQLFLIFLLPSTIQDCTFPPC